MSNSLEECLIIHSMNEKGGHAKQKHHKVLKKRLRKRIVKAMAEANGVGRVATEDSGRIKTLATVHTGPCGTL